ncbi:MAG TPA: histone deacetylase family protein, partial [Tabrizicola sp.]|nr:histone deacetylase family protein [Tabrizicola sp.]
MLLFTHEACHSHVNPPGHPERVERLAAVERGLAGIVLDRRACPMGEAADVLRCHPARYLERVRAAVPR